MPIKNLSIENIRNIRSLQLQPAAHINIIHGVNGSGKTSLLESINFLGLARSFRTAKFRYLVTAKEQESLVFSQIDSYQNVSSLPLGVTRSVSGDVNIRFNGSSIELSELASLLPIQVINTDTFDLLEGSPTDRRQFLDWGVFYFDPRFIKYWRSFKRVLQQRNSLLKCGKIDSTLREVWDKEFVLYAERITELRQAYLTKLVPVFDEILACLMQTTDIEVRFSPGWDQECDLDALLAGNLQRDIKQGFTSVGPQRADLKVKSGGVAAAERLSRGQKKLVVSALKLAQGALFHQLTHRACVYLIDDLPSELDTEHGRQFCKFLEQTNNQCFITCVDPESLSDFWQPSTEVAYFKIENGQLTETD